MISTFFSQKCITTRRWRVKNGPLFLASTPPCRSAGAGCDCDPCLRLAIAEPACLCVGGCDDSCCRRHSHTGAFSFSPNGLISRRQKPSPTRRNAPEAGHRSNQLAGRAARSGRGRRRHHIAGETAIGLVNRSRKYAATSASPLCSARAS